MSRGGKIFAFAALAILSLCPPKSTAETAPDVLVVATREIPPFAIPAERANWMLNVRPGSAARTFLPGYLRRST